MKAILRRVISNDHATIGVLVANDKAYSTIELPWNNNEIRNSCIPAGTYKLVKRTSQKYNYTHYHVLDVPNRSFILIHIANYTEDITGCIGVGKGFKDINKDGKTDITDSRSAMEELVELNLTELQIIDNYEVQ